ncbi:MAG: glycosyltransferase family 2 protein [Deltaproteobacteria bacterium]
MDKAPQISIILPVWNGQKYLEGAIQSVLNQTYRDFQLVIVNDCSTDRSPQIAESYAQKDSRIKVIHNIKNLKLPGSLNAGFAEACGAYFTWTSDDNILHPSFLETLLVEITTSGADIVYSDFNCIDDEGRFVKVSHVAEAELLVALNTIGASFLYGRRVHEKLGGYDVTKPIYEDYDFWVRAYLAGFKYERSDKVVYDYRRHSDSLTVTQNPAPEYAFYRYGLRKKFKGVKRTSAFEARKILMGYRSVLGPIRWFTVLIEAAFYDPFETSKIIFRMVKKVPVKTYSFLAALKNEHQKT